MKAIEEFPLLLINLFESKRLLREHLRDIDKITMPFNFPVVSCTSDNNSRLVLDGWQFGRVGAWGDVIDRTGGFPSQRFMGTLPVVLLNKRIEMALLKLVILLRRNIVLKSAVHALMAAVLAGLARA